MKYISHSIEQLDLAGQQLQTDSSSYGRFALLLTDNAVELLLHDQCRHEIDHHDYLKGIEQCKYSPQLRRKVLGQHFDEKAKFCRRFGFLNNDQKDFILIAHQYRNELYHAGIKYTPIIYAIAWEYHNVACDLFSAARRSGFILVPRKELPEAVKRLAGNLVDDHGMTDLGAFSMRVADSLRSLKPPLPAPFVRTIADFAVGKVEVVISNIESITEDNPQGLCEDEILKEIQFFEFVKDYRGRHEIKTMGLAAYEALLSDLRKNWKPKCPSNPTSRWMARAKGILREKTPVDAMRKFQGLKRDMAEYEEMIEEAALNLDVRIQNQIDAARGK